MKKHWFYLTYLLKHKYFVFIAGLKVKAPIWRLIIHDWSKFLPNEWLAYSNYFYGKHPKWHYISNGQKWAGYPFELTFEYWKERFDYAWLSHQHRNKHHWQHWLLKEDSGKLTPLEIPNKYIKEMVADWAGAGRAIKGKWEVKEWFEKNREKIMLNQESLKEVEWLLKKF